MFRATHLIQSFFSITSAWSLGDHLFPSLAQDLKSQPSISSYPSLLQARRSVILVH
jgi:hypothetical protein